MACIGPAGENLVRFAAIICNQARAAARCGPGAVMGSKNLKAIAVRWDHGIRVADKTFFQDAVEDAMQAILSDPLFESAETDGTLAITGLAQGLGFLPTRNFQQSTFSGADKLKGEVFLERYEKMLSDYYLLRGWSLDTGAPTREKRIELGLE
ncbi:Tungsten-containing aldehyde:ferredoxin oxidoreductase (EC [Olavius algarvensis Delta 1 endosymbiont]|nr:Tungsten-containing aldehyde:ferredoxin oxidoreductase (EC [Olavius algarvensis Delta 1 endosymbiont]